MTAPAQSYAARVDTLKAELLEQARRVASIIEHAFDALFAGDTQAARRTGGLDDVIDRADVEIERATVRMLADATTEVCRLSDDTMRSLLTIVKVNNELERIADAAVAIADGVAEGAIGDGDLPDTLRVMCNSVVGIMRDVIHSLERSDARLAHLVLQSEDAVEQFKAALLRDAEESIAAGQMAVDLAFALHEIASRCERMADHCTNIAEQIIYAATGTIVRHTDAGWIDLPEQSAT